MSVWVGGRSERQHVKTRYFPALDPSPIALAARQHWDVIVIGTGMGGGMAGRRLAERGLAVLFVEKGPVGYRGEVQRISEEPVDYGARQMLGFWPAPVEARMASGQTLRFFAPLGSGVGGSSCLRCGAGAARGMIWKASMAPPSTGGVRYLRGVRLIP